MNDDGKYPVFTVRTEDRFGFRLRGLCMQPALSAREMQIEMLRKVKEIPGLNLDRGHFGPQVSFAIELVNDPLALHKFKVAVN